MNEHFFIDSGTGASSATGASFIISTANLSTPHFEAEIGYKKNIITKEISPRLYFKYVKSKMSPLQQRHFEARMKELESLADKYARLGQEALSEECIKQFIILSRESAIYACGYTKFILPEHVEKFKYQIRGTSLKITPVKNFARELPKEVQAELVNCIDRKLFDSYVIFHTDNKAVKETEKERVEREKDPILFGKLEYSDKYYFIIDWEDAQDDLTFKEFVEKAVLKKAEYTMQKKITMPGVIK